MLRTQRPAPQPESRLERGGLVMEVGRDSAPIDSPIQGAEKDGPGRSKNRKSFGRPLVGPQCAVCGEEAPSTVPYRRHYGVICCEACKCFFRRTVQMNKHYECKLTGNCAVGKNVRHWCQACRFQKCIKSGMKIEAVKGLGVNKKSKEQGKRARDERREDSRQKVVKYEKSDSSDPGDMGEDLLSHPVTSPDTCIGHTMERKNGGAVKEGIHGAPEFSVYPMGSSYSPLNLSLASPIAKINSPPSVSTLSKKLQAAENAKQEELDLCHSARMTSPNTMMAAGGGYYQVGIQYGKSGNMAGGYGGGGHHTNPPTPVAPTPSYPASYQSTPCPSACPSPYHHSACHSANNTPYTTPYGTPVASPVSNRNTPHATPLQSPAPSPTPHLFVNPPYHVNAPSLPPYSEGIMSGNNSPALSHRSHAASCPVSPISGANSPNAFSSTNFPFSATKMGQSTFVDLQPSLSMTGRLPPLQGVPGRGRPSFELSAFSGPATRLPDVSTAMNTASQMLQEPNLLPTITPTLGNPDTPPIPTPQPASTSNTQVSSKRAPIHQNLPEAEVEEVLDSLRLRITAMFKWAKSEVAGFEDLSPLDQKALLRRTVAELVMLGFARASIAFDGMLRLGGTGKAIRPSHENSGIASVANITLMRLVTPLKVLNIDDKELELMKEIVLFNSEADGLRSRELVRQLRKRRLIELMEYTKNAEPGRFGELMCLLTPLFEVSLEVTEQLRLEQFVYEGEARIDALLLMSMINDAGNIDVSVDSVS